MDKKRSRLRRAKRTRMQQRRLAVPRICVFRSANHIYAQVIAADGSVVVASASTMDKEIRGSVSGKNKTDAAKIVGNELAARATKAGIKQCAFDRSGFKYHGRVKALAEGAREGGMEF